MDNEVVAPNPMLGSQLVCKSIVSPARMSSSQQQQQQQQPCNGAKINKSASTQHSPTTTTSNIGQKQQDQKKPGAGQQQQQQQQQVAKSQTDTSTTTNTETSNSANKATKSQVKSITSNTSSKIKSPTSTQNNNANNGQTDGVNSKKLKSVLCKAQEAQLQQVDHRPLETNEQNHQQQQQQAGGLSARESELLAKEAQDLKTKTRKLQLEIEEKNEIINVLKDELETLREQSDKYQRENLQLVKDAKRVKFLQDENDFLQDKVGSVEKLELEISRLKGKLNEVDFLKLRIGELEEDRQKAQEESVQFEDKWREAECKLTRVGELEIELNKWKSFSHELEQERNSIQSKLLESIEQESKLNSINKKVEDEVKRLRDLIKSYEEQRDEEQASNSLIMSVADLKRLDEEEQVAQSNSNTKKPVDVHDQEQQTDLARDTMEKSVGTEPCEVAEQANDLMKLDNENRELKKKLEMQTNTMDELSGSNRSIREELEGNRKLISDLRQDLACEKSLAKKLASQLSSFTKQIKSLDKQYFPIHDTSSTTVTNLEINSKLSGPPRTTTTTSRTSESSSSQTTATPTDTKESSLEKSVTSAASTTPTENRKEHHKLNAIQGGDDDDDGRDKPTKNGEEKKSPLAAGDNKQQVESKSSAAAAAAKSTPAEELNAPNRGDYAKLNEQKRPSEQNTTGNNGRVQCEGDATGNTNVNGSPKSDRNFLDGLGEERRQQSRKEGEEEPELTTKAESARSSSSTYSSSALSSTAAVSSSPIINKSAPVVTIESFKIDKDTDESSRTKLASTTTTTAAATTSASATNYAINLAAARKTSANLTTKTVKKSQQQQHHEEHQRQQQQQEDRFDQQELARRTLFSPLIDSSEDELRAKRKHGQNNININGQHHKTVATASSLSSISPSSSARSQSSSPPSVAVTIGHDSGFQSINHDFNQLSPKSSSSSADSRHRDPHHHHHHHQPHQQQLVALAQSNRSTPITGRIMQATSREILDGKCLTPTQFRQDSRPVASACSGSASASGQRRSSPLAAAATCATGQQVAANAAATEPVLSKSTPATGTRTTSDGSQPNKQRRENQRPLLSAANVGVVGAPTLPSNRCANQTDASPASSSSSSSSSSSPTNNNYNRTKLTLRDTNSLATTTTTATKTNNHVIDKNGSQSKATGDEQTHKSSSSSNFVRNSLPSRSVNFGHSKPTSAYLDRIRASVSATTTTSSSSSSTTTNFNELSNNTRNLTLSEAGQHRPATVLNCMLDHQHVARCFVSSEAVLAPGRVQVTPREAPHQLLLGHPQLVGHPMHHHHYHQALSAQQQPAASRQLNALIDPVANEQLMLTMLHQQHQQQQHQQAHLHHQHHHVHLAAAPNQQHPMEQTKLTDEQIARLNNLHRQHYYHHLHQLHQMHHQVHLHHQMHHQQQNIGANQQEPSRCKPNNPPTVSQFYAPGGQYDEQQVYANMAANSSQQRPVGPINLVNHENNNNNSNYLQRQEVSARSVVGLPRNPSTVGGACLPPIGEVNGLPVVHEAITTTRSSPNKPQQVTSSSTMPNNSTAKLARLSPSRQVNATKAIESPVQSASTSPTSSSSSSSCHMSPSSATSSPSSSSSSSLNSLTASSALNRSSQCRHTTTNVELANRRQFSVERELINSTPMTATLSRVGSCRGMPTSTMLSTTLSQQQQQQQHQQVRNNVNVDQMRNPVKLQQPPLMRTSKILNISAQQSAAGGQVNSANSMSLRRQQQHQQLTDGISALTNNLADIKLNDGLAFSSLRAPKKSSSGSNLNRSLNGNLVAGEPKCRLLVGPNGQRLSNSGSNSPEKQKQPARQPKSNQDKVEPNNNAKSSSVCR